MLCMSTEPSDQMEEVKDMEEKVRNYEAMYIMKPDLEEEERERIQGRIKNVITDNDGEINEVDEWGNRNLAYEVKDYTSGYYMVIDFNSGPELFNELEHNFKIIGDVIRHLIVRKED